MEGTRTLTTRSIVIAAGARPPVPPIPGLAEIDYLTSDNSSESARITEATDCAGRRADRIGTDPNLRPGLAAK